MTVSLIRAIEITSLLVTAACTHKAARASFVIGAATQPLSLVLAKRLRIEVWAAAFLGAAIVLLLPDSNQLAIVAPTLCLAAFAFVRHRALLREARRLRMEAMAVRETSLLNAPTVGSGLVVNGLPFLILASAAVYLTLHWVELPMRWAIHWNIKGEPNGFAERTFAGVFGPLLLGAGIIAFIQAIQRAILKDIRQNIAEAAAETLVSWRVALRATIGTTYLLALVFAGIALIPTRLGHYFLASISWMVPAALAALIGISLGPKLMAHRRAHR